VLSRELFGFLYIPRSQPYSQFWNHLCRCRCDHHIRNLNETRRDIVCRRIFMSKVIYSEIYVGSEDQPDGNAWSRNQVGLKSRIWSKPFCKQIERTEAGWIRKALLPTVRYYMSVLVGCSRKVRRWALYVNQSNSCLISKGISPQVCCRQIVGVLLIAPVHRRRASYW